jgi:predicted permease
MLPIFLLIALGFAAAKTGAVSPTLIEGLGYFVLNFALPALILHALLSQDLAGGFNWNYIAAYAGGSLVVFLGVLALFRLALGRPLSQSAMAALGGSSANTGFMGFPIASMAIGAPALTALPLTLLAENVLIIPLALALGEMGLHEGRPLREAVRRTLMRLARSPIILAILAGGLLAAFGFRPPTALAATIEMMADVSAATALFVVGGTLAGLKAIALAGDVLWITLAKLALHPLAVAAAFWLVGGVPAPLVAVGIIFASAPMLTVYPIFGQRFGQSALCSAALVVATAASFITVTIMVGVVTRIAASEPAVPQSNLRQTTAPCPPRSTAVRRGRHIVYNEACK